jgi:WD40 repeat protein
MHGLNLKISVLLCISCFLFPLCSTTFPEDFQLINVKSVKPLPVPHASRFVDSSWSNDGREIRILYQEFGGPHESRFTVHTLDSNLHFLGTTELPAWEASVEKDLIHDLRSGFRLQKHRLSEESSAYGVFVYPLLSDSPLLKLSSNELNFPEDFAFSPNGRYLAIGGNAYEESVILCEIPSKRKVWESIEVFDFPSNAVPFVAIQNVVFSSNGVFIASISDHGIVVREMECGKVIYTYLTPKYTHWRHDLLAVSNNGQKILVRKNSGTPEYHLIDLDSGLWTPAIDSLGSNDSWSCTGDFRHFVVASDRTLQLYDLQTGLLRDSAEFPALSAAKSVDISPSETHIFVVHFDNSVSIWEISCTEETSF